MNPTFSRPFGRIFVPFLLTIGAWVGPASAGGCPASSAMQDHPQGNYDFKTGSYEETGQNGYRNFHTCVLDYGKSDFRVIWYVPGMDGWLVPGKLWDYPRKRHDVVQQYADGCLSYSVDPPLKAQFSGTMGEKQLATNQVDKQCAGLDGLTTPDFSSLSDAPLIRRVASQTDELVPMELPVSVLFPSNLAAEHETMLEFKAFAMLQPEGEHAYRNRLSYSVTRVDGRPDGDPSRVRMRPMFRGETERLYPDFTKFYPDGFKRLGNEASRGTGYAEGELRFEVSSPGKWVFAPAVFAFIDSDDRILAEVEIPAFAPAAGN